MKHFKRFVALLMALALCLSLAAPAFAVSSADSSDFVEEMEEIPLEEEPLEEEAAEEEAEPAEEEMVEETAEEAFVGTIVGFGALENNEIAAEGKPTLDTLVALMPETMTVTLDSGDTTDIPVTWTCLGDYEDSDDYYFQFCPKWDESRWAVADSIDVAMDAPYVAVCLKNLEVKDDGSIALNTKKPNVYNDSLTAVAEEGILTNSASSNKGIIFNFITGKMGMNSAAACGIMANIQAECSFNETAVGGGGSYGLCQWLGSRKTRLINWCRDNGYNYKTVEGQMNYLAYELPKYYSSVDTYLRKVNNTAQGAYDAAYYWCAHFEMPSDTINRSITRGNLAKNTFWPQYGATLTEKPAIYGQSVPGETLEKGKGITIYGTIACKNPLTKVTGGIYDASGTMVCGKTVKPNTTTYNLNAMDSDILFASLNVGTYTYKVVAATAAGSYTLINVKFKVVDSSAPATPAPTSVTPDKVAGMAVVRSVTNQISFTWKEVAGATGYEVYYCSRYNGTYTKLKTVTAPGYTTGTALKVGTDYYYKVRALIGTKAGSYSDVLSAHTQLDRTITMATTSSLNIRAHAGTAFDVVKTIAKGAKVTQVSQTKDADANVWYRVTYTSNGVSTEGYCMGKYLTVVSSAAAPSPTLPAPDVGTPPAPQEPEQPAAPAAEPEAETPVTTGTQLVITKDALNLRKSADSNSSALTTVPKYTTLVVSAVSGSWYKVSYTKSTTTYTGYLSGDYLIVGNRAKVTAATYIYSKTSTTSTKNKTMAAGTRVLRMDKVTAADGSQWYKVKYTKSGLCFSGYIKASLLKDY